MARDIYFALAYFFVLCKDDKSKYMFESLASNVYQLNNKKVGSEKEDGTVASDASNQWQKLFNDVVLQQYKCYSGRFPNTTEDDFAEKVSNMFSYLITLRMLSNLLIKNSNLLNSTYHRTNRCMRK